jgi:tRNA-Thr(GGU) m(6)t(6)A37 methyltransferase TsaA
MKSITLTPVGVVRSTRNRVEDDNWDAERCRIELDPLQFSPDAFAGLEDFSHVEVLFFMDRLDPDKVERAARHPRNNVDWPKVGIFAQRAKYRPNQIGATICKILKVDGLSLDVEGLDAIDGSPVLDVKPWVIEFEPRGSVSQPKWISELMRGYWRK